MEKRAQVQSAPNEEKKSPLQEVRPDGVRQKQYPPLDSVSGIERTPEMATMALPFEAVEQNLTFVSSGVYVAQAMSAIRRGVAKTFLTVAFYDAISRQAQLIEQLPHVMLACSEGNLIDLATRLEHLSESTSSLVETARLANFALWADALRKMAEQGEKLDSLAESFRMSASDRFANYVGDLVVSGEAVPQSANESWRDFVATLQD